MEITREQAARVLQTVDAGLIGGLGKPIPGQMCVEAAVCYALDLPHGDNPQCVNPALRSLKIRLNDSRWSSDKARTKGMRELSILQLGTDMNFDKAFFVDAVVVFLYTDIMPAVYSRHGNKKLAAKSKKCKTRDDCKALSYEIRAFKKAADAAAYAADAADAAAYAAYAAAAASAAYAAKSDLVLLKFAKGLAKILISMNVPGVAFLDLL